MKPLRFRVVPVVAMATILSACTGGSPEPVVSSQAGPPSPSFHPTAPSPQAAVDLLRDAWRHDDRGGATRIAPETVVATLFRVSPRGWSSPRFSDGAFHLSKRGVPGRMDWSVQGIGTGYFVNVVTVPPIPLRVADITGRVWGLYLAAGGSGYSQLAAASSELQDLGLTSGAIALLPASCQSSVPERLEIPSSFSTVAVFFQRKSEAEAFRSKLDFPPIGLLKVSLHC
jgi:hypothetical protein